MSGHWLVCDENDTLQLYVEGVERDKRAALLGRREKRAPIAVAVMFANKRRRRCVLKFSLFLFFGRCHGAFPQRHSFRVRLASAQGKPPWRQIENCLALKAARPGGPKPRGLGRGDGRAQLLQKPRLLRAERSLEHEPVRSVVAPEDGAVQLKR